MFTLAPRSSPLLHSLPKPHPLPKPQFPFLLHHHHHHHHRPPLTLTINANKSNTTSTSTADAMSNADATANKFWEDEEEEETSTADAMSDADATADKFWEDEEEEEEEEEGDEEEEFLAFEDMRKWELNKPAGFGEGKVYDTTVEEKILVEMETEMEAELSVDKNQPKSVSKKQELQQKALETPRGPCVRLGNLPKKKNIHRDLRAAFKGFPGIVNISPSVSGNRKTRDPICKGFAFVEFASEEAANRFSQTYSKQTILFGKVQKQVSCEVIDDGQVDDDSRTVDCQKVIVMGDESFHKKPIELRSVDETTEESSNTNGWLSDFEGRELCIEHSNISPSSNEDISQVNIGNKGLDNSILPTQKQKKPSKKKVVKTKQQKSSKTTLPSSMARLKIKERSVLTEVLSKYGAKVGLASD